MPVSVDDTEDGKKTVQHELMTMTMVPFAGAVLIVPTRPVPVQNPNFPFLAVGWASRSKT